MNWKVIDDRTVRFVTIEVQGSLRKEKFGEILRAVFDPPIEMKEGEMYYVSVKFPDVPGRYDSKLDSKRISLNGPRTLKDLNLL